MKPVPDWLPAANSRKWHSRRWWDSLGYLRVRSLANPNWGRDMNWLLKWLRREAQASDGQARQRMDAAIRAAERYKALARRAGESDDDWAARIDNSWDEVLSAIDSYLELRQQEHVRRVEEAGRS